jgi:two-component system LytT family response regulator
MEDLEAELDPALFYRINRQFIVQRQAIKRINYSFNGKLTINVSPKFDDSIVISKSKAKHFKEWMGSC